MAAGGALAGVTLGWVASVAQAVAYAANDGQKMIAVVAVSTLPLSTPVIGVLALLFAAGAVPAIPVPPAPCGGRSRAEAPPSR